MSSLIIWLLLLCQALGGPASRGAESRRQYFPRQLKNSTGAYGQSPVSGHESVSGILGPSTSTIYLSVLKTESANN